MTGTIYKIFFEKMGEMLSTGIPLTAALEKCQKDDVLSCKNMEWDAVLKLINNGVDLVSALRGATPIPETYLDMIGEAEQNGELDEVFETLATEDINMSQFGELDLFSNVLELSDENIQMLLRELNMDELASVMLTKEHDAFNEKFRRNMSERAIELLDKKIKEMITPPFEFDDNDNLLYSFEEKFNKLFPGFLIEREEDIIQIVNQIIKNAVEKNASDIHIIPTLEGVYVKFRIDGILVEQKSFDKSVLAAVNSRIKSMACLDVAEKRLPQDGRIKLKVNSETIDIRTCVVPGVLGEKITMRILKTQKAVVELKDMSIQKESLEKIYSMIDKPWGLIFVTGATGSGKTTTCYGMLNEYIKMNISVVTIEDPVEYVLDGVTHIQVRPNIGLTFPAAIRASLRTDPDVIFIGEIRDEESLKLAIRAAQTGHVVICQMHSDDVRDIIDSLSQFKSFDRAILANTINGIVGQKLLRKLCDKCKVKTKNGYTAKGCKHCLSSGYRGRIPCNNVFEADHEFKIAFSEGDIKKARKMVKKSLIDHAEELVEKGITSRDEIFRVFGISR